MGAGWAVFFEFEEEFLECDFEARGARFVALRSEAARPCDKSAIGFAERPDFGYARLAAKLGDQCQDLGWYVGVGDARALAQLRFRVRRDHVAALVIVAMRFAAGGVLTVLGRKGFAAGRGAGEAPALRDVPPTDF